MKKSFLITFLAILTLISSFILTSCGFNGLDFDGNNDTNPPKKLQTPLVLLVEDTAKWTAIENADKYEISINGELHYIESSITEKKLNNGDVFKIRAISGSSSYTNSDWSNAVTYVADVTPGPDSGNDDENNDDNQEVVNKYTVVWKSEGEILETDENVVEGSIPLYNGETPTKQATAQYTYEFSGWSPTPSAITSNQEYVAQFNEILRSYTVTFYDEDGITLLDTVTVEYGSNATYTKVLPTKEQVGELKFTFDGWVTSVGGNVEANLNSVTNSFSVYAKYASSTITHFVYFYDEDETTLLTTLEVVHGANAIITDTPYISGKRFVKWDKSLENVTSDLTVYAIYETVYLVEFIDYDGSIIASKEVSDSENVDAPINPNRNNYEFIGWLNENNSVTFPFKTNKNLTITANYVRLYNVIFVDYDGEELKEEKVRSGASATAPTNPTRVGYTFTSWDIPYINVTTDLTITAQYEINKYKVTFVLLDGSLIEQEINHGDSAIDPCDTEGLVKDSYYNWSSKTGYKFKGWDKTFNKITEETTVTALKEEIAGPILVVDSKTITQGTEFVSVSIYLSGTIDTYGFEVSISYDKDLILESALEILKINGVHAEIQTDTNEGTVTLVCSISGKTPVSINGNCELIKLNFMVGSRQDLGEYSININNSSYIINNVLTKQTPYIISGEVNVVS